MAFKCVVWSLLWITTKICWFVIFGFNIKLRATNYIPYRFFFSFFCVFAVAVVVIVVVIDVVFFLISHKIFGCARSLVLIYSIRNKQIVIDVCFFLLFCALANCEISSVKLSKNWQHFRPHKLSNQYSNTHKKKKKLIVSCKLKIKRRYINEMEFNWYLAVCAIDLNVIKVHLCKLLGSLWCHVLIYFTLL